MEKLFFEHQKNAAESLLPLIRNRGVAYCAGEPRTGKTATALLVKHLLRAESCLVLTKKAAIKGWESEINRVGIDVDLVTNYEQAKKIKTKFDLVILDEAHALGKVGKINQRIKDVRKLVGDSRILCLSGTPVVESPLAIFHQFFVSSRTPFKHKSFYDFFREWGISEPIWVAGRMIESYKACKPELVDEIGNYTITITKQDAGIKSNMVEHIRHEVPLRPRTIKLIDDAVRQKIGVLSIGYTMLETESAVRSYVLQAEFGAYTDQQESKVNLLHNDVIDYLSTNFEMRKAAVMCHYKSTKYLLGECFPQTSIYSSAAHAEGVDLSHHNDLIIIGTDFSGAKHIQRIERQSNLMATKKKRLHFITTSHGLSGDVLASVSNKKDHNIRNFRRWIDSFVGSDDPEKDFGLAQA